MSCCCCCAVCVSVCVWLMSCQSALFTTTWLPLTVRPRNLCRRVFAPEPWWQPLWRGRRVLSCPLPMHVSACACADCSWGQTTSGRCCTGTVVHRCAFSCDDLGSTFGRRPSCRCRTDAAFRRCASSRDDWDSRPAKRPWRTPYTGMVVRRYVWPDALDSDACAGTSDCMCHNQRSWRCHGVRLEKKHLIKCYKYW